MDEKSKISFDDFKTEVLKDYYTAVLSREISVIGRKEVLNGKAKFGIFGDGKEIAQLAMAKVFENGDFRSGYYRDQTFMLAAEMMTAKEIFAQLYGDTSLKNNPSNGGRLMNNHFATRSLNEDGSWKKIVNQKNSSPDISPTAGQMPRLLGLASASRIYRNMSIESKQADFSNFTRNGNEVAFGTIGDASTSEGHFFETMNAAGVMQVPLAMSVWDDGWGISVSKKYQTTKQSISELLKGLKRDERSDGFLIYKAKGWDYPELCKIYKEGVSICREQHIPVLFHIEEMTQPNGHSTSGSHERYKSKERLNWETEFDPISKMREWLIETHIANNTELDNIENKAKTEALQAKKDAWNDFQNPIKEEKTELLNLINSEFSCGACPKQDKIDYIVNELQKIQTPIRKDNFSSAKKILRYVCQTCGVEKPLKKGLANWLSEKYNENADRYSSHLYSKSENSALKVVAIPAAFSENSAHVQGREIIRDNFDILFSTYPELLTFGEDSGRLGDVNQGLEGLQEKYGENRIFDTGIREATILGQAIGLALRGFRPIAEIQYFDYLLYALQTMSDDLATMLYRTKGGQKAPVIIRTRGHRLEGVWHSGSPLSMVINSIRGIYVCVPRNMNQAAGFYNTLLKSDDTALVVEPLNGYRVKEKRPDNIGEYCIQLGVPEILNEGTDIAIVTYGSCVRIAQDAVIQLSEFNISCELIDVQTLLPFDINHTILQSIKKTNKVLFFDEDVPGGATAFMMQKVLEEQKAFQYLDSAPRTLTAKEHRPAYTTDGDYFSNPNAEDVFERVYEIMNEYNPTKYPKIY
ncbi:MAG TPA: transketolase [Bacteroidales bacterium]|nr:MAG: transketolase [Bacteroidetes bacterium GWF2_33_38]OFY89762.1 MAG: transketolase [Bacteroidetes bacterium RIFOXYA2_FULL_33_7]HBF87224.1 transketolase [Bacteroidales bacterium]